MLFIFTVLTNDSESPDRHDHVPLSGNAHIMHTCLTPLKYPRKIGTPLGIDDRRLTSADFRLKIHGHSKRPTSQGIVSEGEKVGPSCEYLFNHRITEDSN
jgi:hypothetical protein